MSQLKNEEKGNLTIGQKVIGFIKSKRFLFSNRLPDLGERWTIKSEHFNSYEKRLYWN